MIDLASEVSAAVRNCMEDTVDYGEVLVDRMRDVTRRIDMVAERALEESLRARNWCARIISEEQGDHTYPEDGEPQFTLIFDPVDGSTNAILGIPVFCTSIAYSPRVEEVTFGDIRAGVVETFYGRRYYAVEGGSAFVGDVKLPRTVRGKTKRVLSIYTYGADRIPAGLLQYEHEEKHVVVRLLGSIATELCLVAEGVMDAMIDVRGLISGYDIAAASLILREAGGILTDLNGRDLMKEQVDLGQLNNLSCIAALDRSYYRTMLEVLGR